MWRENQRSRRLPVRRAQGLGMLLILLLLTTVAAAQNATVTTTVVVTPIGTLHDFCTNEDVSFSGSMETVTDTWFDASGATHLRVRIPHVTVTGVGKTTGNEYRLLEGLDMVEKTNADLRPLQETIVFRFAMNGAGPALNEQMLTLFHLTVNPAGDTTAEVDQMTGKCNGK